MKESMPSREVTAQTIHEECLEFVEPLTPSIVNYASISALNLIEENCNIMKVTAPVCSQICKLNKEMYAGKPIFEDCALLPEKFVSECKNRGSGQIYYQWSGATTILPSAILLSLLC